MNCFTFQLHWWQSFKVIFYYLPILRLPTIQRTDAGGTTGVSTSYPADTTWRVFAATDRMKCTRDRSGDWMEIRYPIQPASRCAQILPLYVYPGRSSIRQRVDHMRDHLSRPRTIQTLSWRVINAALSVARVLMILQIATLVPHSDLRGLIRQTMSGLEQSHRRWTYSAVILLSCVQFSF